MKEHINFKKDGMVLYICDMTVPSLAEQTRYRADLLISRSIIEQIPGRKTWHRGAHRGQKTHGSITGAARDRTKRPSDFRCQPI